ESYYNEAIPENLSIDKIKLSDFGFDKGIQAGLTSGKIFKNAKNPKDLYKVSEDGYSIEKLDGGKINVSERNLILYSEPENKENLAQTVFKPSFLGRKVLYNPQFNFVSNPYSVREQKNCGKYLSLMSK
nr:hypothetical protein [bacterium]